MKVKGERAMKNFLLLLLTAATTAFAEVSAPTRVDFASQPSGATVVVDGVERGLTPLTLFDLKPGSHRTKFRLAGYEDGDRYCQLELDRPIQQSVTLEPINGILLLRSEPSECNITIDGVSVGLTPRLVTTLPVLGTHHVVLEKAGYRPSAFDVKFAGRKPVVRTEKMLLDAGILEITTDPAGAEVTVNGVPRGKSPVTVRDVPRGEAVVKVKKDGFEDETREVRISAGDRLAVPIELKGLPGTLFLSSVPDGARFYVNDDFRGVSPVSLKDLTPGTYEVRAEMDGYGTMFETVEVGNGAASRKEFRLSNVMGRIEVVTIPVGVQVSIDNRILGTTKSSDPNATKSDPFAIENVLQGEHVVTLKADGYTTVVKHPVVENSKTEQLAVRLKRFFRPDVILHTPSGEVKGRLIRNGADYIEVEISLGVVKSLPRDTVRKLEFIEE